jgi:Rrf2 family protein
MTLLPRTARSALLAVLDVALHSRGRPVSSRELAARHKLPPRRLEGLLQALVHAGVLRSLRGPSGGYELARERRRLTLAEIVRVALRAEDEREESDKVGAASLEAALAPALEEIEAQIFSQLGTISIEDLYARALANGAGNEQAGGDFAI